MSEVSSNSTPPPTVPHKANEIQAPNIESHSVQITTIRLNGDNILRWSRSIRMYIRGHGKIGYLIGDKPTPAKKDPTYATQDAENSIVMTWLVNSMDKDISSN